VGLLSFAHVLSGVPTILSLVCSNLQKRFEKEKLFIRRQPDSTCGSNGLFATIGSKIENPQIANGKDVNSVIRRNSAVQQPQVSGDNNESLAYLSNQKLMDISSSQSEVVENVLYGTRSEEVLVDNDLYNI